MTVFGQIRRIACTSTLFFLFTTNRPSNKRNSNSKEQDKIKELIKTSSITLMEVLINSCFNLTLAQIHARGCQRPHVVVAMHHILGTRSAGNIGNRLFGKLCGKGCSCHSWSLTDTKTEKSNIE